MFFSNLASSQHTDYYLLIGRYTSDKNEGINTFTFNSQTGNVKYKSNIKDVGNPSYLAVSANHEYVYAVNEFGNGKGMVSAFTFNRQTGELDLINQQSAEGDSPCYVAIDSKGKHLFIANYSSGSTSAFPVNSNGSLGAAVQVIQNTGSGPNKQRQEKPHAHASVLSPDEKYLLVTDLGTDEVIVYPYNAGDLMNPLDTAKASRVKVSPGFGPRHLAFHPKSNFVYVVQELSAYVSAYVFKDGKMEHLQDIAMEDADFKGMNGAADIHVSPDGKFVYASNRGDAHSISIYKIDQQTGKLTFSERTSTLGKAPRNFIIDPSGKFLLVANQDSNNIVIFKRNEKTGSLTDTGKRIESENPNCLKLIPIQ
jgi:6-phosphogluconolactonase